MLVPSYLLFYPSRVPSRQQEHSRQSKLACWSTSGRKKRRHVETPQLSMSQHDCPWAETTLKPPKAEARHRLSEKDLPKKSGIIGMEGRAQFPLPHIPQPSGQQEGSTKGN